MSEEKGEIVRQPVAVGTHSRRRLEECLAVRFPRLLALLTRAIMRLPQRSRLRRSVLRRAVETGWEAMTMSGGGVIRDQVFMSHRDALEAAGLSE